MELTSAVTFEYWHRAKIQISADVRRNCINTERKNYTTIGAYSSHVSVWILAWVLKALVSNVILIHTGLAFLRLRPCSRLDRGHYCFRVVRLSVRVYIRAYVHARQRHFPTGFSSTSSFLLDSDKNLQSVAESSRRKKLYHHILTHVSKVTEFIKLKLVIVCATVLNDR